MARAHVGTEWPTMMSRDDVAGRHFAHVVRRGARGSDLLGLMSRRPSGVVFEHVATMMWSVGARSLASLPPTWVEAAQRRTDSRSFAARSRRGERQMHWPMQSSCVTRIMPGKVTSRSPSMLICVDAFSRLTQPVSTDSFFVFDENRSRALCATFSLLVRLFRCSTRKRAQRAN